MAFCRDPVRVRQIDGWGSITSTEKLQVFDSNAMPWEERFVPNLGRALFAKRFLEDPETGVTVRLVQYPADFTNGWNTHPRAMACSC